MADTLLASCLARAEAELLAARYAEYLRSEGPAGAPATLYVRAAHGGRIWEVHRRETATGTCQACDSAGAR